MTRRQLQATVRVRRSLNSGIAPIYEVMLKMRDASHPLTYCCALWGLGGCVWTTDLVDESYGIVLSTSASVVTSSSICAGEMISGGDSAMVSPVVRINRPFSNAFTSAS